MAGGRAATMRRMNFTSRIPLCCLAIASLLCAAPAAPAKSSRPARLGSTVTELTGRFHLEPGETKGKVVACPSGTEVIGGGYSQNGADGVLLSAGPQLFSGTSDYEVAIEDPIQPPDFRAATDEDVTVLAQCAEIGKPVVLGSSRPAKPPRHLLPGTLHRVDVRAHIDGGGGNSKDDLARCPAGTEIISGGFHQSQNQGVPLAVSPSSKQDGYEAFIYNPPSNPSWLSPSGFGRVVQPDDVQIVALCGEIGRPLVPGRRVIDNKPGDKVKVAKHPGRGTIVRSDKTGEMDMGQNRFEAAECPRGDFALSGGLVQNSYHGVLFASEPQINAYVVDTRNPQPNPLWGEPDTNEAMEAIALCAPTQIPIIPGHIPILR